MWLKLTIIGWQRTGYQSKEPEIKLVNMDRIKFTSVHQHGTMLISSQNADVAEMVVYESVDEIWSMINGAQT